MSSDVTRFDRTPGLLELWGAILAGPALWAISFQLNYILVPLACDTSWHYALHANPAVAFVLTLAALFLNWGHWREAGVEWPSERAGLAERTRFLAVTGIVLNTGMAALIAAQWITVFLVSPCQH